MLLNGVDESFLLSKDEPLTPNIDGVVALWSKPRALVGNVARRDVSWRVSALMLHGRFNVMQNNVFL